MKDIEKQLIKIVELGVTTSNNLNKVALKVVELEKRIKKNEKIHNRSQSRVASTAGDDWPGAQGHGQYLGALWPPDLY